MSASRTLLGVAASFALVANAGAQTVQHTYTNVLGIDDVEITPDQRFAVVRQNNSVQYALVYDLATGNLAASPAVGIFSVTCGEVLDAVAVTNDRAVVLGGVQCAILDLNNLANPVMAQPMVGYRPNDVAITPDGTIAVVRGGNSFEGGVAGTYCSSSPPRRRSGSTRAIRRSTRTPVPRRTRSTRTAWWSRTATPWCSRSRAAVHAERAHARHDLGPAPDGRRRAGGDPRDGRAHGRRPARSAARRRDHSRRPARGRALRARSGRWSLQRRQRDATLRRPLTGVPGAFEDTALDSVEVTDALAVTLANVANSPTAKTQVEVVTWAGVHYSGRIDGLPHDLAVTADGTRAVVRTGAGVALYDLAALPPSGSLAPADWAAAPSVTNGYQSGLDSVAVSDEFAVTLTHEPNLVDTRAWFWSIARGRLQFLSSTRIPNSRPTDVLITPDLRRAVVTGNGSISVFHLGSGGRAFEHHPAGPNPYYQWCDGAAATLDRAVGVGQRDGQAGWVDLVRTAPFATRYCTASPNSTGRPASILAMGDASVAHNSLKLCVDGAPSRARGRFVYGPTQVQVPFGDGVQCVGGQTFNLRVFELNAAGSGFAAVDFGAQTNPGGIVLPGSTWNYQFLYLDRASSGFGFNSSDALNIVFAP
jgi:hypothetical protein